MHFDIPYEGDLYRVSLALLDDGHFSAHDAGHLEAYCAATLVPGSIERDFSPLYHRTGQPTEPAEFVLNAAVNMATVEGKRGGWLQRNDVVITFPWGSWWDVPREVTEPILRAAMNEIDSEQEVIDELAEFYSSEEDEPHRRIFRFRNSIDRVFWRFSQASTSLSEAHALWRAHSRHAVEHYLILKNLMGEKPEGDDEE